MVEVLEPSPAWVLRKVEKEIQRRLEMSRQIRDRYFKNGDMEAFYYWNGYVGALYDVLSYLRDLERKEHKNRLVKEFLEEDGGDGNE